MIHSDDDGEQYVCPATYPTTPTSTQSTPYTPPFTPPYTHTLQQYLVEIDFFQSIDNRRHIFGRHGLHRLFSTPRLAVHLPYRRWGAPGAPLFLWGSRCWASSCPPRQWCSIWVGECIRLWWGWGVGKALKPLHTGGAQGAALLGGIVRFEGDFTRGLGKGDEVHCAAKCFEIEKTTTLGVTDF